MSFNAKDTAQSGPAITAIGLGKCYTLFDRPTDRLKQLLWGRAKPEGKSYGRDFWALRNVDLSVGRGEVVGIVGRNGAGKSTLLQMVCGTLAPTTGTLRVQGRVAALLELGAGFSPDFTGLENVYMNAAILGLKRAEVDARLADILAFADIGEFIHQPVKTYSSGMFMRLAFSVATSVDPDILVIDEALSVGDGAFARKSFERIMQLKDGGATILFCSHSMYQVEALCSRALWIEHGAVKQIGPATEVTCAYSASLDSDAARSLGAESAGFAMDGLTSNGLEVVATPGAARLLKVTAHGDGASGREVSLRCGVSDLTLIVDFVVDPALPVPGVGFGFSDSSGRTVASASTVNDGVVLQVNAQGIGRAKVVFEKVPLLKGRYDVTTILTTEDGLHPYEIVMHSVALNVSQLGLEQGVVTLAHRWSAE